MMIENLLQHTVWAYFMKLPSVQKWASDCMRPTIVRKKSITESQRSTVPTLLALAEW